MPDVPETNAGLNHEEVVENDRQAIAAAYRAERKIAEQRLARAQRRAQVEEANVTVQQFSAREMSNGVFPMQDYIDLHATVGSHQAATPSQIQLQRRMEAMGAVKDADEQSASEMNQRIGEAQAEHRKRAAEGADNFRSALSIATIAVGAFTSAVSAVNAAQMEGSKSTNDLRTRRAQAMRSLGYSTEEIEARQKRSESGVALPGNMTSAQEVSLLEQAAAVKGDQGISASMVNRTAIDAVLGSNASITNKAAAMRQPLLPQVIKQLRTIGDGDLTGDAGKAAATEAQLSAGRTASQADASRPGAISRAYHEEIQEMIDRGGVGGIAAASLTRLPWIGENLGEPTLQWLMKIHDEMRGAHLEVKKYNNIPPSTTGGR
jgi:hypothetical protein